MDKNEIIAILQTERDKMFRYACYRLGDITDVEDVLQDLYVTLMSKERVLKNSNPIPYIYRTLSNICTSRFRDKVGFSEISIENIDITDDPENYEEDYILINNLLSLIPDEQSEVIRLHLHSDLSFKEIAEVTGQQLPTVKSRYRYGLNRIREKLKQINKL